MAVQASGTGTGTKLLITGGSHTFQILNETSTGLGASGYSTAFERLFNHICEQAFHNSDECDEIKCHPGTRTAILKALFDFANDTEHPFITWLNGPAGAGKTAIGHSLAEQCEEAGILAACFFFWRTDPGRSDEKRLIPSLAYQLCLSIPPLRPFVEQKIADDPAIFSKTLKRQLYALILAPLQQMRESHSTFVVQTSARLIIIDGLDECGGLNANRIDRQGRVLEILSQLASHQEVFPFRILIISRTEAHIRRRFDEPILQSLTRPLLLDYSFTPEQDILVFVTHEFLWIVSHHPFGCYLPSGWPGIQVIQSIVDKSSGQFIYAATVMKFIRSELHRPDKRVLLIQGAREHTNGGTVSHFAPIDTLYRQIFCSAVDASVAVEVLAFHLVHRVSNQDSPDFCKLRILRSGSAADDDESADDGRIEVKKPNSAPRLTLALIEKLLKLDPGVVPYSLSHFEALFRVLPNFNWFEPTGCIEFHHASFTDFLLDKERSQEWFIDIDERSIAFALAHMAELENTETEPAIRKGRFIMFCAALERAPRTPHLDSIISDKWLRPSQYSHGRSFLELSGPRAYDYLVIFQSAAAEYYKNTKTTGAVIKKTLLTDVFTLMEPQTEAYRSDPVLFALLLYCFHNYLLPDVPYTPGPYFSPSSSNEWLVRCCNWLARYIEARPSLAEIDSNALQLVRLVKSRSQSEDLLYTLDLGSDNKLWLHSYISRLLPDGIYVPPDDELLKQSTILILKILIREAEILSAHTDREWISMLLGYLSPSAEVADLVERICRVFHSAGSVKLSMWIRDTTMTQYRENCSHLPRSGLPPDFSFIDQEDEIRNARVSQISS